jgi:hypothetical protein
MDGTDKRKMEGRKEGQDGGRERERQGWLLRKSV